MANPCGGLSNTPSKGDICQHGYITGVLMSEEKLSAITETSAALLNTWQALLLADMPNRLFYLKFDKNEFSESEIVEEEMDDGSKVILMEKESTNKHMMISSLAGLGTSYKDFKSGRTMHTWFVTNKGYILGKKVTANTIEQVQVRVYSTVTEATPTSSKYINWYIQNMESWQEYANAVNPDFTVTSLSSVQMMTFTVGTTTPTTIQITAKDLDGVAITGLSTSVLTRFTLYNEDDSAPVSIVGITRSGGVYTLQFAGQTVADEITVSYVEPSVSTEYFDLVSSVTATIAAS